MRKVVVFTLFCLAAVLAVVSWKIIGVRGKTEIAATPVPTPTPTPLVIDQSSNLAEEVDKLTPQDFSEDFQMLRQELDPSKTP